MVLVDKELEVEVQELFVEGGGLLVGDEDGGVLVAHFHEFEEGFEVDSFGVAEHSSVFDLEEHISEVFELSIGPSDGHFAEISFVNNALKQPDGSDNGWL